MYSRIVRNIINVFFSQSNQVSLLLSFFRFFIYKKSFFCKAFFLAPLKPATTSWVTETCLGRWVGTQWGLLGQLPSSPLLSRAPLQYIRPRGQGFNPPRGGALPPPGYLHTWRGTSDPLQPWSTLGNSSKFSSGYKCSPGQIF